MSDRFETVPFWKHAIAGVIGLALVAFLGTCLQWFLERGWLDFERLTDNALGQVLLNAVYEIAISLHFPRSLFDYLANYALYLLLVALPVFVRAFWSQPKFKNRYIWAQLIGVVVGFVWLTVFVATSIVSYQEIVDYQLATGMNICVLSAMISGSYWLFLRLLFLRRPPPIEDTFS